MTDPSCLGIFRERTHSPGRESDDTEILRLTAKELEAGGFQVTLKSPEEIGAPGDARPRAVFMMCEGLGILGQLDAWQVAGTRFVNNPGAVLNTYRERMIGQFCGGGRPLHPERSGLDGDEPAERPLPAVGQARRRAQHAGWRRHVRREHRHRAGRPRGARRPWHRARGASSPTSRETSSSSTASGRAAGRRAVPPWFRWFYHKDQRVAGHPLDPHRLARLVKRAAGALGLEVYGGDAIATPSGDLVLLDLNAWPSFALYRDEAAPVIAAYLTLRFGGGSP